MHTLMCGHICIDKNTSENASYTAAGGPAIFMYEIFSELPHVSTTIVSPFGKDFLPFSHNLPLLREDIKEKTLIYENISQRHTRSQKAYNRTYATPPILTTSLKQLLTSSDILFLTPLLPNFSSSYIERLEKYTTKNTLKVLLPQGYYRNFQKDNTVIKRVFKEEKKILPLVDIVIVSIEDGDDMLQKAKEWSEVYPLVSIVTLGEKGAVAYHKGEEILLPTKPVGKHKIIDSVGSGDIFSASFAYAFKKTRDIQRSGKFANTVARACLFYPSNALHITIPAL